MQCRYCQAWNESDERRCVRCGRRLHVPVPREASTTLAFSTSTAPDFLDDNEPVLFEPPKAVEPAKNPVYQPLLFRDAAGSPKVIPIPTLTPMRPKEYEEAAQHASRTPSRSRIRRTSESQQSLDFPGTPKTIGTQVEAVIYCDAPVALPAHRAIAAAFDAAIVLMAIGVFLAIFFVSGGVIAFTKQNIPFFVGVGVVMTLFYRFLWCVADGDTPGMRFAGLRLVDFDGRTPDREQRGMRQVAGILSLLSAGLGLVWALVDEESLTWHDHISKTFPTVG
jgi:uncharacterized RDD family membrane protein YckC